MAMKIVIQRACFVIAFGAIGAVLGCSSYSINREITHNSKLDVLKKSGIVFRLPRTSLIKYDEYSRTLLFWINSYKKINDLKIIAKEDGKLFGYPSELERFYQISMDGDFLALKSQGSIYQMIHEKDKEIRSLMEKEDLDSIILYEVEGDYSTEMQYVDFTSLVAIIDQNLDILYLDHQTATLEIDEFDPAVAKNNLLDSITKRLLNCFEDLDYIEEK